MMAIAAEAMWNLSEFRFNGRACDLPPVDRWVDVAERSCAFLSNDMGGGIWESLVAAGQRCADARPEIVSATSGTDPKIKDELYYFDVLAVGPCQHELDFAGGVDVSKL